MDIVPVRHKFPLDPRNTDPHIIAGVFFVEDFHGIGTQRSKRRGFLHGFTQTVFDFVDQRKVCADLHKILNDTRVLADRTTQRIRHGKIIEHRRIDDFGHLTVFLVTKLL